MDQILTYLNLDGSDLLLFWCDIILFITWIAAISYCISGFQDMIYDIAGYSLRLYKRIKFRDRKRLTLERLKSINQQHIAIFVPAWSEAEVIPKMVENILQRAEYDKYVIFVGTYPNDHATQEAVDKVAAENGNVIKVITSRPGPTCKADCLNRIYDAMKRYEVKNEIVFEIIAMHDAEDMVHPYEFLLLNYLLPRVDAIQTPILPLPTSWYQFVHWVYADEFTENHMKDLLVRENISGFVPFAGVGTGFSRRSFRYLERVYGPKIFNEDSLTEDYSLSLKMWKAGLKVIFVNVLLGDDRSPWWKPLCQRKGFISNWAYFPFTFWRSVRQKTRWITGISFQEWEQTSWIGGFWTKEALLKDRKGYISSLVTLLGYVSFIYFLISWMGESGWVPFHWRPFIFPHTFLWSLIIVDTCFMVFRLTQRVINVTWVYGPLAGILALPRFLLANIINSLASFRAFHTYLEGKRGKHIHWDKTAHVEGLDNEFTSSVHEMFHPAHIEEGMPLEEILEKLQSDDADDILVGLRMVTAPKDQDEHYRLHNAFWGLRKHPDWRVRAALPMALEQVGGCKPCPVLELMLYDKEWIVRANAARGLLEVDPDPEHIKVMLNRITDKFGKEILLRTAQNSMGDFMKGHTGESLTGVFALPSLQPEEIVLTSKN